MIAAETLRRVLPKPLWDAARTAWLRSASAVCRGIVERRRQHFGPGFSHRLGSDLIISLTSYPARFRTLHLTLACLLDQTIKADRTILWIAHGDITRLPGAVRELEMRGLEIRASDDLRSYKKLIPTLEAYPDAFVATADDDVYYPRRWLEMLVSGAEGGTIASHRAHRVTFTADGAIEPYAEWGLDVQDRCARAPSTDILPTGVGGILYPPNALDPRVTDRSTFQRLCQDGDDLWFYWCARMAGTKYRKVGPKMWVIPWAGSQSSSLWSSNEAGGNDAMIAALENEFGYLDALSS